MDGSKNSAIHIRRPFYLVAKNKALLSWQVYIAVFGQESINADSIILLGLKIVVGVEAKVGRVLPCPINRAACLDVFA